MLISLLGSLRGGEKAFCGQTNIPQWSKKYANMYSEFLYIFYHLFLLLTLFVTDFLRYYNGI